MHFLSYLNSPIAPQNANATFWSSVAHQGHIAKAAFKTSITTDAQVIHQVIHQGHQINLNTPP